MYHIHFAVRIASTLFPGRRLTGPTLPDGSAAFFRLRQTVGTRKEGSSSLRLRPSEAVSSLA